MRRGERNIGGAGNPAAKLSSSALCCPVCGLPLTYDGGTQQASGTPQTCGMPQTCGRMICEKRHSYDISREGYVNLLMSNQSSARRHGDDRLMVEARASFLGEGYYIPIADMLAEMTLPYVSNGGIIVDAGCGDGWYAERLTEYYAENGIFPEYIGIDISKAALRAAARRKNMTLAVASAYKLPIMSSGCDVVLSIFAPIAPEEFRRVLRRNGTLFTVTSGRRHLYGLKELIYDKPYENGDDGGALPGFTLKEQKSADFTLNLEGESIKRLFMMTPYYYKTSRGDQQKLDGVQSLVTEVSAVIRRYEAL